MVVASSSDLQGAFRLLQNNMEIQSLDFADHQRRAALLLQAGVPHSCNSIGNSGRRGHAQPFALDRVVGCRVRE